MSNGIKLRRLSKHRVLVLIDGEPRGHLLLNRFDPKMFWFPDDMLRDFLGILYKPRFDHLADFNKWLICCRKVGITKDGTLAVETRKES